jgi:hypothetical protein
MIGWEDLFEEGDKIYLDQSFQWAWPVSTGYTPYGIRKIDNQFGMAIRATTTMVECRKIAEFLIACPSLHLVLKENLMLNLVNVMTRILGGKMMQDHACTTACFKDAWHRTCQKKAFNGLVDRFGAIPLETT